jgi:hypothetical protein
MERASERLLETELSRVLRAHDTTAVRGRDTMKDSALNRWLWLIGLAAVALLFVSFGPLSSGQPKENASGASVAHWYNTHVSQ